MKLYYARFTRSSRPRWMLEELGVPYELARLNLAEREHKSDDYLAIHPFGQVPALIDGDTQMFESGAICLYLADKFADKGLGPTEQTRSAYYQWVFYAATTLEAPLFQIFMHGGRLPEEKRSPEILAENQQKLASYLDHLELVLAGKDYLLGYFSTADVILGSVLLWASGLQVLGERPNLQAYVQRLKTRPAYQRATQD